MANPHHRVVIPPQLFAAGTVLLGSLTLGLHTLSILRDQRLAGNLISDGLWRRIVGGLGGTVIQQPDGWSAELGSGNLLSWLVLSAFTAWLLGGVCLARHRRLPFAEMISAWGVRGWLWWMLPLVWEACDVFAALVDWPSLGALLPATLPFWHGLLWAGWLATGCALGQRPDSAAAMPRARLSGTPLVWIGIGLYVLAFGGMNIGLYEALQLPHGDSAMYEEHLWNLLHGKGFRSYLDNGRLFLGEHIQVIHLLLIPLYLVWPSQILLELCQSLALACGAIPAYRIARRHTGSNSAATALALAYLCYVPMQSLDIAVDFKTFRPNSFEIPLFLLAFDALEARRWRTCAAGLVLALLCQEDAATILAPLGVWLALRPGALGRDGLDWGEKPASALVPATVPRRVRIAGIALALFGTGYLILVIKVLLPWFRGGADVHFAQYFDELGGSSNSIVVNIVQHPQLVLARLLDVESLVFALALVVPLGVLPLFSPGRLAIAAPLFGVLCLSDITNSPQHHFHAPLIPVLFWAAAAGLPNVPRVGRRLAGLFHGSGAGTGKREENRRIERARFTSSGKSIPADGRTGASVPPVAPLPVSERASTAPMVTAARWSLFCSACVGFFLGLSPLSLSFWDPDSRAYWRAMYLPGERARQFPAVLTHIPISSRVASTDFIHPRFTHFDRSYDYSDYRPDVPDDADFIVIDTRHPYSSIQRPDQIKELREHPEEWEVLPDDTKGYFITLKRKRRDSQADGN